MHRVYGEMCDLKKIANVEFSQRNVFNASTFEK
jgi:hypothetical protein